MEKTRKSKTLNILIIASALLLVVSIGVTVWHYMSIAELNRELSGIAAKFKDNPETKIGEREILGVITIDRLNLEYPIITFDNDEDINITVCLYNGSGLNQYGNNTLTGSRAKSGLFFANIGKLEGDDTVKITDTDGFTVTYRLLDTFIANPDSRTILGRSFNGNVRELTIFTASSDSTKRYVYKFVEIKDQNPNKEDAV